MTDDDGREAGAYAAGCAAAERIAATGRVPHFDDPERPPPRGWEWWPPGVRAAYERGYRDGGTGRPPSTAATRQ